MLRRLRIAISSIITECKDFGGQLIDIDWFRRSKLRYGQDFLNWQTAFRGTNGNGSQVAAVPAPAGWRPSSAAIA